MRKIYIRKSERDKLSEEEKRELQFNQIASWAIPAIVSFLMTLLTIKAIL